MNNDQRIEFWKTLCSLDGKELQADQNKLKEKIVFPRFIYRYREVTSNNLDALRSNRLFFSSANYYDDPFDTFLYIDKKRLQKEFDDNFKSSEAISRLSTELECALSQFKQIIPSDVMPEKITPENLKELYDNGLTGHILSLFLNSRDVLRKRVWSVCFSESGLNETLWLKYANQYKGFVVFYDLENQGNLFCGQYSKCEKCGIYKFGTPLYPMVYSNEPYDATDFAKWALLKEFEEEIHKPLPPSAYSGNNVSFWDFHKITLIKKICHQYDAEWRLITGCQMKPPILMEWRPDGIILGLRMSEADKNLAVSLALQAGVKKVYASYIDDLNRLGVIPLTEESKNTPVF